MPTSFNGPLTFSHHSLKSRWLWHALGMFAPQVSITSILKMKECSLWRWQGYIMSADILSEDVVGGMTVQRWENRRSSPHHLSLPVICRHRVMKTCTSIISLQGFLATIYLPLLQFSAGMCFSPFSSSIRLLTWKKCLRQHISNDVLMIWPLWDMTGKMSN